MKKFSVIKREGIFAIEKLDGTLGEYSIYWNNMPWCECCEEKKIAILSGDVVHFSDPNPNSRCYFFLKGEGGCFMLAERKVAVESMNNLRDLGGYRNEDGLYVRYGVLFRGDDLFPLTRADAVYLENMGIKSIIDYRGVEERNSRPNKEILNTTTYICSPNSTVAALASASMATDREKIDHMIQQTTSKEGREKMMESKLGMAKEMVRFVEDDFAINAFRDFINVIKRIETAPSVHHCRGGKDRTGYGSALILFILGVSEEDIKSDYLLTAEMNKVRNMKRMAEYRAYTENQFVLDALENTMSTDLAFLEAAIDAMKRNHRTPLEYIKEKLGVTDDDIEVMRKFYLYDPQNICLK